VPEDYEFTTRVIYIFYPTSLLDINLGKIFWLRMRGYRWDMRVYLNLAEEIPLLMDKYILTVPIIVEFKIY